MSLQNIYGMILMKKITQVLNENYLCQSSKQES